MVIYYEKRSKKQLRALPVKFQHQFYERVRLFMVAPDAPLLRVHPLKGNFAGYWSMNVSGDLRALYRRDGDEIIIFALIGTHGLLYGR